MPRDRSGQSSRSSAYRQTRQSPRSEASPGLGARPRWPQRRSIRTWCRSMRRRRYSMSRHLTTSVGVQMAAGVRRRARPLLGAGRPASWAVRALIVQKIQASASRKGWPRRCGPPRVAGGVSSAARSGWNEVAGRDKAGSGAGRRSRKGRVDSSLCMMRLSAFGGSRRG